MISSDIPLGWNEVSIEDISDNVTKGSTPTTYGHEFQSSGIPFLRAENIFMNNLRLDETKFISKETHEFLKRSKINPDDVLITIAGTIGRATFVPKNAPEMNSNQAVAIIKLNNNCLPKYLSYFLNSNFSKKQIFHSKVTTSISNLSLVMIKQIKLPLPDLQTQKKIIDKLDHILKKLDKNEKSVLQQDCIKNNKELKNNLNNYILQTVRTGFYKKNEWSSFKKDTLVDITTVTAGGTPSRGNLNYWDGDIPWIKSGELEDDVTLDSGEHITEEGLKNSSAKLFPENTVLIALYGQGITRGKTTRLLIKASTNQACCGILPTSDLNPLYLQYWLRSMYNELRNVTRTGPQPNWNAQMIKDIEIVIPPLEIQNKIVDKITKKLDSVKKLKSLINLGIENKVRMLNDFSQIKSQILNEAFAGKLVN